jgi:hypothetical protein
MSIPRVSTIVLLLSLLMRAGASNAAPFIISYWAGPPSGGNYDAQYAEVAECNFTHAMFPVNGGSPEQNKAILAACEKHGLKYIPYDGRVLKHAPGDPAFAKNLDAVLVDYKNSPALAGYFLTDEPGPGAFPQLAAITKYLHERDPQHPAIINLLPNYVDEKYIGMTYEKYLDQFCAVVKPAMLCYDHYALFQGQERDSYFANMETIRWHAVANDIPMWFIFLCTPHGTYRDPSETDLQWQVNTGLAYGCKALLYFTYFTPIDPQANFHDGILDAKGKRTPHFAMAQTINGELKKLGPVLVRLKSTAVYHTGTLPKGCTALPAYAPIGVNTEGPFLIGLFQHDDGSRWAMIVNREFHKTANASLRFQSGVRAVEELSAQTGALAPVPLSNQSAQFTMPPGSIRILKFGR